MHVGIQVVHDERKGPGKCGTSFDFQSRPTRSYLLSDSVLVWSRRKILRLFSGLLGIAFVSLCCYELSLTINAIHRDDAWEFGLSDMVVNSFESLEIFLNGYMLYINALNTSTVISSSLPTLLRDPIVSFSGATYNTSLCEYRSGYYRDLVLNNEQAAIPRKLACGIEANITQPAIGSSSRSLQFLAWPYLLTLPIAETSVDYYEAFINQTFGSFLNETAFFSLVVFSSQNFNQVVSAQVVEVSLFPFISVSFAERSIFMGLINAELCLAIAILGTLNIFFFCLFTWWVLISGILVNFILLTSYAIRWYYFDYQLGRSDLVDRTFSLIELGYFCSVWIPIYAICVYFFFFLVGIFSIQHFSNFFFIFLFVFLAAGYIGYVSLGDSELGVGDLEGFLWMQFQMMSSQWPAYSWWDPARHEQPVLFTVWQFMNGGLIFCVLFNFFQAMVGNMSHDENSDESVDDDNVELRASITRLNELCEERRKTNLSRQNKGNLSILHFTEAKLAKPIDEDEILKKICAEAVAEHTT